MKKWKNSVYRILGFLFGLQLGFILFQVLGINHWPWLMVFIPLIVVCVIIIVYCLILLINYLSEMFNKWEERYWKKK